MTTTTEAAAATAPMPRIGDPAPAFTALTTQGEINFPGDYEGKWVILFSHPADFTPVCTTKLMTFASMQQQFAEAIRIADSTSSTVSSANLCQLRVMSS